MSGQNRSKIAQMASEITFDSLVKLGGQADTLGIIENMVQVKDNRTS